MGTYNNNATADLNEHNLGVLAGYEEGKAGKKLNDLVKGFKSPKYKQGVGGGFDQYLNDVAGDEDGSMRPDVPEADMDMEDEMGMGGGPDGMPSPMELEGGMEEESPVEAPEDESLEEGVEDYNENPTVDSFVKVFNILNKKKIYDGRWLKMAAVLSCGCKSRIADDGEMTIEYWLNRLLAEEFNAWYQYYIVEKFLVGEERPHIQESFKEYGDDELDDHAKGLLERLHDLGYEYSYLNTPKTWDEYASVPYVALDTDVDTALGEMVKSEKAAIDSYTQAVQFAESIGDVVSRDLFKNNLKDEEEHLAGLMHYLKDRS